MGHDILLTLLSLAVLLNLVLLVLVVSLLHALQEAETELRQERQGKLHQDTPHANGVPHDEVFRD